MGYLIFMSIMVLAAILIAIFVKVPANFSPAKKGVVSLVAIIGLATGGSTDDCWYRS
jgi:hypothetical protein